MRTESLVFSLCMLFTSHAMSFSEDEDNIQNLNHTGADYLRNVMVQLQQERNEAQNIDLLEFTNLINMDRVSEPAPLNSIPRSKTKDALTGVITAPTPSPPIFEAELRPMSPPPPALTAEELTALYKVAISKGALLPQIQGNNINQIQPSATASSDNSGQVVRPATQGLVGDTSPGYYYYFYPIKSFQQPQQNVMAQLQNQASAMTNQMTPAPAKPMKAPLMENESKGMEPLFMAITGFIGMALMFIFSVLFLPRLGNIRSSDVPELKEAPNELAVLGKLIFESLDGKDCTERIACEVGRVVRRMKMEKVFKVMEIILPPNMARQIGLIRSAAVKKEKCNFIPCRFKTSRPPTKADFNIKPWKKGPSPHDLWMKHFEKDKNHVKQTDNMWSKKNKTSISHPRLSR